MLKNCIFLSFSLFCLVWRYKWQTASWNIECLYPLVVNCKKCKPITYRECKKSKENCSHFEMNSMLADPDFVGCCNKEAPVPWNRTFKKPFEVYCNSTGRKFLTAEGWIIMRKHATFDVSETRKQESVMPAITSITLFSKGSGYFPLKDPVLWI